MLAVREVSHWREFGQNLPGSWDHNTKMRYLYVAYREFIKFAYGTLGRRIRKVFPACVVKIIRQKLPKLAVMNYIGFHYYDESDDDETVACW